MHKFTLWEKNPPAGSADGFAPTLTYYPAENKRGRGAVVILPGGGYLLRSSYEGEGYALYLNGLGLDAFVLDYRVHPDLFPAPLLDARRALRYVRANADVYGIDPEKIAVMGSSAGGHLSALLSTYRGNVEGEEYDDLREYDCLPSGQILCYPVIDRHGHPDSFTHLLGDRSDEMHEAVTPTLIADERTPPAFMWHTSSDPTVNVANTYRYAAKLGELGIPCELHVFPLGSHGLGLADEGERDIPYVAKWSSLLADWLRLNGYLN